ncbi:MAG: PTS ascorbate transporter subunit IIC [Candidatus Asgardarchaeia archaeon]
MQDVLTEFLVWIADNILGQPAFLVGIVVMLGLIIQKKSFSDIVLGTTKTMAGFLIMSTGAGVFVDGLIAFQTLVQAAFGIPPAPTPGIPLDEFMATYGGIATVIMAVGFFIHLLIARFTPLRYVYLTGHLMWWVSLTVVAVFVQVFGPGMDFLTMVGLGSVIMALYWSFQPAYIHKYMKVVRGKDDIAYGHTSSIACFLAAALGKYVGSPEESSEKIKLPANLAFFKDVTAGTAAILIVIMAISAIAAGPEVVAPYAGDMNYIIWAILQGIYFAAGITILLAGVRMILAEIVPAFKGISEKVIPGAKPALDCPIIFPVAPTAVLIGFLASTAAFLPLMIIFAATGFGVVVPPMIQLFFPGGAAGVYGDRFGGWKGAVLGGLINGAFLAFGQALTYTWLPNSCGQIGTAADPDWYILIAVLVTILGIFKGS